MITRIDWWFISFEANILNSIYQYIQFLSNISKNTILNLDSKFSLAKSSLKLNNEIKTYTTRW